MLGYDRNWFDPPAPLAHVTVRNPMNDSSWIDVPMLLDSGADITMLPSAVVDRIGVSIVPDQKYELVSFDGNASFATLVQLELVFLHRTFRGQYLLIDQEWGIIGRNIMNRIPLLFNGPHLEWDEHRLS
jgi:hypothetical protein